ncbi:hypothetical protein AMECASPLE_037325 [Ameca splendens]|uniref:Uncharacterized protein n=1 Tax=Ameca splendens TaxID=208324 RepID=A0ABV0YV23_9TELE
MTTGLTVRHGVISRLQQRYIRTGRITERHRSGHSLATSHTDDCLIVKSALWRLIPLKSRHIERHPSVMSEHLHLFTSAVCELDNMQGYLTTSPGPGIILNGSQSI